MHAERPQFMASSDQDARTRPDRTPPESRFTRSATEIHSARSTNHLAVSAISSAASAIHFARSEVYSRGPAIHVARSRSQSPKHRIPIGMARTMMIADRLAAAPECMNSRSIRAQFARPGIITANDVIAMRHDHL